MIKTTKYLSSFHKISTCLIATHFGPEGYGGVPEAALEAVRTYGRNWVSRTPKLKRDVKIREFLKQLVKYSCPPGHTNWSQTWIVFEREAAKYAALDQLPPPNPNKRR